VNSGIRCSGEMYGLKNLFPSMVNEFALRYY
jgi:hypothetical protein